MTQKGRMGVGGRRQMYESESRSVVSDSLQPHGLYSPWNSPGQNTGVGSLSLLQWIFPTQELNQGLLHCRQILHQLSYQGRPKPQCSTERDAVTTCHVYLWSALSVCHRHQTEMQGYIADIFPATVVFLVQRFRSSGKADILKVRLID